MKNYDAITNELLWRADWIERRLADGMTAPEVISFLTRFKCAKIRLDRDPATMSLGGVRCSCTAGANGLLRNWIAALALGACAVDPNSPTEIRLADHDWLNACVARS
jgi:hypothetical protein